METKAVGGLAGEVLERLRVLVVAGVAVGVIVAGVGSRLAMLLLRVTSPDEVNGLTSDDGFRIGQITLGGTYSLLALGAGVGIIGVGAYRAVAPWLLGPSWFRRATTAAGSAAVVGALVIHDDGVDFAFLKPTWLAIGLFVALPAVFGAVIGAVVERVAAPGSWSTRGRRRWAVPVVLVVAFPPMLFVLAIATVVVTAWVALRRTLPESAPSKPVVWVPVRAAWLAIALVGLVALVRDVDAVVN